MTRLEGLVREGARALRAGGVEAPELEARILAQAAFNLSREALFAQGPLPAEPAGAARFTAFVARRLRHEPVALITGRRGFFAHEFKVTPDTLIPRPDSECLVSTALAAFPAGPPGPVLDLGTGSGCLVLSLLAAWPHATGVALDRSAAALAVARDNARVLGLAARCRFVCADWTAPLRGPFALIVANPPYIPQAELSGLPPDVRLFEPRSALDGGPDGLGAVRALAAGLAPVLARGGLVLVEHGPGQEGAVADVLAAAGLVPLGIVRDLEGRARAAAATDPAGHADWLAQKHLGLC